MVRRKELENSQRTISDIEKHLETSKLKLKELVAEGNQKMNEKANLKKELGTKYLVFFYSRSVKMRVSSAFSVCIFLRKVCLIFNFLNDKMHNYVKQNIILHFIIQNN